MRRLAVLGLLGLRLSAAVLRIHWCIRHLSLGYDARKLGEAGCWPPGRHRRRPGSDNAGELNAAMAARSMVFMVSLLISRPRLGWSGVCSIA